MQRVLVSYNTAAAAVRILKSRTSPFPFSISKASPAGFFLLLAQTQQNPGGKAIYFFMRKASNFFRNVLSQTLFVYLCDSTSQGRGSEATEAVFCLQAKKPLRSGSYGHRVPKIKKN